MTTAEFQRRLVLCGVVILGGIVAFLVAWYVTGNLSEYHTCYAKLRDKGYGVFATRDRLKEDCSYHWTFPLHY